MNIKIFSRVPFMFSFRASLFKFTQESAIISNFLFYPPTLFSIDPHIVIPKLFLRSLAHEFGDNLYNIDNKMYKKNTSTFTFNQHNYNFVNFEKYPILFDTFSIYLFICVHGYFQDHLTNTVPDHYIRFASKK